MKLQDLTFERIEHYDPLNLRAKRTELFKRQLRKYIKHKLAQVLYGVSMFMILTVPPLAMIIHWILKG